ncbi:MAG TPA: chemotaxis protein CheA [Ignavibacteria bacterium]|nr:chemotaxis protein CheA [Ignavibacteria bacterium]
MLTDPEMKEIVESFIIESKEILEKLDVDLIKLENNSTDNELLNEVFRYFHTIKGTSGFLGLDQLTKVTHRCEDILNKLRKGDAVLTTELMDGILEAYDRIKELLSCIETNQNEDVEIDETVKLLTNLINQLEGKNNPVEKVEKIDENIVAPEKSDTTELNEEEISLKAAEENLTEQKTETKTLAVQKSSSVSTAKKAENNIRVDVERLDELLNIASELVLGRNRLAQVNSEFLIEYEGTKFSRDLADATKLIDLMTNELQLVVMKTRMVKIGKVFNRFPRVVRDLAKENQKEIKLIIKGEDTELDKTLIEEINDPLVHLVRNSVDHGIETPEARKKAGKNPVGTIILSAEQEGNLIIISIEDDGNGINPDIIKEKAISKGLLTKDKAKELSKLEVFNLIFLPGFSTAEVVTKVSGRGVGMDVVKTNVTKLRGLINIESVLGEGTKIIIKLPLTLAIIPGMVVKLNSETIVIPLNSVIETFRIHIEDIHTINGHEAIKRRDGVIPLVAIDGMLYKKEDKDNIKIWQYIVVVGIAEKKFGIKVDELLGQKEVVIKSLGNFLGNINGIAGSTIMGDGTVVMIIDISELIHKIEI